MGNLYAKTPTLLIGVLVIVMLVTANSWGVIETSEARYAEISREMYRSGDWLHPKLLGIYHYHKPPVTYWITAIAYSLFGVTAFAARFFLTVSFLMQIVLIFRLTQLLFNNKAIACYATLVYATLPLVLISVRGLTTDAYLATFVVLSIYLWVRFLKEGKFIFLFLFSTVMGLGFMTKGPVALLVPLFAVGAFWKVYPFPRIGSFAALSAFVLFLLVAFSWFVFLAIQDPRLVDYFFFRHFIDRMTDAEIFSRKEPWYYYLLVMPAVCIPWIVVFMAGFLTKDTPRDDEDRRMARRVAVWSFLLPLVVFSVFSSKRVLYILPLSIGFSMVCGYLLSTGIKKAAMAWLAGLILFVYIGLITISVYAPEFRMQRPTLVLVSVAFLFSAAMLFLIRDRDHTAVLLSTVFAVTLIVVSSQVFRANSIQVNSLAPLSAFIKQNNLREGNILVYNQLLPSVAFDLDKDIVSLYAGNRSLRRETQFETDSLWRGSLIDTAEKEGLGRIMSLLSEKSVLIVKGDLPTILQAVDGSWRKVEFGKWTVYYN